MSRKFWIRVSLFFGLSLTIFVLALVFAWQTIKASLPQIITVKDYKPLLVSHVYDRNNKKIGEFFRERRTLVPYAKIPKNLVNAFLAAEDDSFFQHKGINYAAIARAMLANLRAGQTVQGASTITQQVAKTLMLSPERTILRKIKEALLSFQIEENLSKEDILYLYLNQIYFGESAYGVEAAAQTYFKKSVDKLEIEEMALLAGLPKAPSEYAPTRRSQRAKERQVYVLNRMAELKMIPREQAEAAKNKPIKVYVREKFDDYAPFYLETVRQILVQQLGEEVVLDQGIRVMTSLDLEKQKMANEAVKEGLKALDKRQGYRGPLKNLTDEADISKHLKDERKRLVAEATPERIILADGTYAEPEIKANTKSKLPFYLKLKQQTEAVVRVVDDKLGFVEVELPEGLGLIPFESMKWARKPNFEKKSELDLITKPSQALKKGDVIFVRIVAENIPATALIAPTKDKKSAPQQLPDFSKHVLVELDQEPLAEAALLSFDQQTSDVLAMVGGYNFARNEYNRALQAARQTGSSFKAIVYAAALDKGYNPSTPLMDVPAVYEERNKDQEGQEEVSVWKPSNHGKSYGGELTFRNSLVRSLNIPAVKLIEDIGVPWSADYAKRLGVFSPLNMDFTLALGSSSVTLYEMTKVFSHFGRMGKRIRPLMIKKVLSKEGQVLLQNVSLDLRFEKDLQPLEQDFEERRKAYLEKKAAETAQTSSDKAESEKKLKPDDKFFFNNEEQLLDPRTAYIMTTLLKGVVEDRQGTGGGARALGHETAAKTGTTSGYFDAWFVGYTAHMATGVWVGFDQEKTLGAGEVGGRAALPIWLEYMKPAHATLPQMTFPVPDGIVFANIDIDTGKMANASSKSILKQAFVEGTEPSAESQQSDDAADFLKQDLTE